MKRKRIYEAIELLNKRQSLFIQFLEKRKKNPFSLSGRDYMIMIQASFYDDLERWCQNLKTLLKEMSEKRYNNDRIKIFLTGAPFIWPNFKIIDIIESCGGWIVGDELCSGIRWLYDRVEVDEYTMDGMLQAIATRYFLPSTCPCFVSNEDRLLRLFNLYSEFKSQGIVYHCLRLCQLYEMELYYVKLLAQQKGIPLLALQSDYSQEDREQLRTRIEAFYEVIHTMKNDNRWH